MMTQDTHGEKRGVPSTGMERLQVWGPHHLVVQGAACAPPAGATPCCQSSAHGGPQPCTTSQTVYREQVGPQDTVCQECTCGNRPTRAGSGEGAQLCPQPCS